MKFLPPKKILLFYLLMILKTGSAACSLNDSLDNKERFKHRVESNIFLMPALKQAIWENSRDIRTFGGGLNYSLSYALVKRLYISTEAGLFYSTNSLNFSLQPSTESMLMKANYLYLNLLPIYIQYDIIKNKNSFFFIRGGLRRDIMVYYNTTFGHNRFSGINDVFLKSLTGKYSDNVVSKTYPSFVLGLQKKNIIAGINYMYGASKGPFGTTLSNNYFGLTLGVEL